MSLLLLFPNDTVAAPQYAVWSEALRAGYECVLSNGGLSVQSGIDGWRTGYCATQLTIGKWIWENVTTGPILENFLGIATNDSLVGLDGYLGAGYRTLNECGYYQLGYKTRGGLVAYHGPWAQGDVITVLLNLDEMQLRYKINGVLTPIIDISAIPTPMFPAYTVNGNLGNNNLLTTNFGATPFLYPEVGYLGVPSA